VNHLDLVNLDKPKRPAIKASGTDDVQACVGFAIRDGNRVTRQQSFSGAEVAKVIPKAVGR
jgi:hypothetical protein